MNLKSIHQRLITRNVLSGLSCVLSIGCGGADIDESDVEITGGTGGADLGSGSGGANSGSGGSSASGGDSSSTGGTGDDSGDGGSIATGGAEATGGADATGGVAASGGSGGTGGTDGSVDAEGCSMTQEGFSTLDTKDQDGTYGGRDGATVTVTNQAELNEYATADEPYVIRVQGKIVISPKGTEIRVASDKTIIGIGDSGEISQGGFFLGAGVHNVIIRNLTIGDTYKADDPEGKDQDWDGIQMDTAHHVWIDHCDLHHIGDGMIDSRKDTTNLTVSWNILRDHNKAFGIGWTENLVAEMTIHHNVIRDTHQRNPSTDNVLRAHLFNNWLLNVTSYGNYARGGTNMVLENSVFENVNNPHYYDDGSLVAIGNTYSATTGQKESSGSSYSFFNPNDFYEYSLTATNEVKPILTQCAGPRSTLGN